MASARERIAGLVLALIGLGVGFAVLEAGVRMLHLIPDRFWEEDPLLGTRHVAGESGWWRQEEGEFLVPIRISEEGWRDVPHAIEKPADVFRIAVLGDSFTEALQVPLEDMFTRRLESRLEERLSRPVEVINTGRSGYGTAAQLLLFRRDVSPYRPDLVLLAFYPGNDVMNNSPELERTLIPVYREDGALERMRVQRVRAETTGIWALLGRSEAYQYGRQLLLRQATLAGLLERAGLVRSKALKRFRRSGVPRAYEVYEPARETWEDAWDRTEWLLGQLRDEVERAGARFAVAIVAGRDEVCDDCWQEVLQTYPDLQQRDWNLDRPRQRLEKMCAEMNIPYVSLAPLMRSAKEQPLHFRRDGHWNPAGHDVAARVVTHFLVSENLIGRATTEGTNGS